jgi:hypothetical protein
VLLWLCLHAAPFIPRMGVYRTLASLDEVRAWEWTLSGAALWSCRHLLMAISLRLLVVRERFWQIYLLGVAGSLLAQVVFIQHKLSPDEIIGAAVSLAIVAPDKGSPHLPHPAADLPAGAGGLFAVGPCAFRFSPAYRNPSAGYHSPGCWSPECSSDSSA